MILVTITINSTEHRISYEGLALEHYWNPKVIKCGPVSYKVAKDYGGYAAPNYGSISLVPDLFGASDWPPPVSCAITIEYTATTEAAAVTVFAGMAHLKNIGRTAVVYDLFTDEYDVDVAATTVSGALDTVFTTYCGVSYLDLTLDTTYARATPPTVAYPFSSSIKCLDLLSVIAAWFAHCFQIKGSTLYLVDMLLNNGTSNLTEDDIYPIEYQRNPAYSQFEASDTVVAGSYPYGRELSISPVCGAAISTDLGNIKTIMERPQVVAKKPIETSGIPDIGERISFTDTALENDTDVQMWVREMSFDFVEEDVTLVGDGAIT